MTKTMRAFALWEFDAAPRHGDVRFPEFGPREVLVRVTASSVNPFDGMAGAGVFRNMLDYRLPAVLGRDVAGTVESVGGEVSRFAPGDEVLGMVKRDYIGDGTFAEFVVVPEDQFIVHRPSELGLIEAGALGLAGVTALQCLVDLNQAEGETILVNGATGGVGAFVIQLAAASGIHVVATARPGEESEHVLSLGASHTVDWSKDTIAEVRATYPDGVDGVVDLISRDPATFSRIAELARPGGTAVTTLSAARDGAGEGRTTVNVHSAGDPAMLSRLAELAASQAIRVPVVDVLPFDRIDDAFAILPTGPRGKVALTLND